MKPFQVFKRQQSCCRPSSRDSPCHLPLYQGFLRSQPEFYRERTKISPKLGCDHIRLSTLASSCIGFQEALVYYHTGPFTEVAFCIPTKILL